MAFRRFKKSRKRAARSTRKSYRSYRRLPAGNKSFAPLGMNEPVRLRYVETLTLDPGVGVTGDYIFRANSLTTPNALVAIGSGTSHQPYGFDQMCGTGTGGNSPMYNSYTVVGSQISVRINNPDNGNNSQALAGILIRKDATPINVAPAIVLEQPGNGGFKVIEASTQGGKTVATLKKKLSVKKFFSINRVVGNTDYSGTATADVPVANTAYYHVIVGPMVAAVDLAVRTIVVTIDYFAVFQQPKILAQS